MSGLGKIERPPRMVTNEPCMISGSHGRLVTGTLLNLSDEGFCVVSSALLCENDMIELRILGTRVIGQVRWAASGFAGGILQKAPA